MLEPRKNRDGLLVEAGLLLDCRKAAIDSYVSIGVRSDRIKREPFFTWLPQLLRTDIEQASVMQVSRDVRFTDLIFDYKKPTWEQPALELAHLFVEAGCPVGVVSHETPDALDAIVARCGLPTQVGRWPLTSPERRHEVVNNILSIGISTWLAVYDVGLPRPEEQRIVDALAGRGVLVNVDKPTVRGAEDALLAVIEERWQA